MLLRMTRHYLWTQVRRCVLLWPLNVLHLLAGLRLKIDIDYDELLYGGFLKWGYPLIIQVHGIFHYKPSIVGYPPVWNCFLNPAHRSQLGDSLEAPTMVARHRAAPTTQIWSQNTAKSPCGGRWLTTNITYVTSLSVCVYIYILL